MTLGFAVVIGLERSEVKEIVAAVNDSDPVDIATSIGGYLSESYHIVGGYLTHLEKIEHMCN